MIWTWLLSPIGRWLGIAFAVVLGILTIFSKGRREGRQLERSRALEQRTKAKTEALKTRDKAAAKPTSQKRKELEEWEPKP